MTFCFDMQMGAYYLLLYTKFKINRNINTEVMQVNVFHT